MAVKVRKARPKRRAALSRVPDTFVAGNGSDSAAGGQLTPWATLAKIAATTPNTSQRFGFRRGDLFPASVSGGAYSTVSGTVERPVVFAAYGKGARPILRGGETLAGWQSYTAQATRPELIPNGTAETFAPDSRNNKPPGWSPFSAGGSYVKREQTKFHSGANSVKLDIAGGSCEVSIPTTQATQGDVAHDVSFWLSADTDGQPLEYRIQNGSDYLQADGTTWSSSVYAFVVTVNTTWAQTLRTFTPPGTATTTLTIRRNGSTNGGFYIDDVSLVPSVAAPTTSNLYRVALAWTPGLVARSRQFLLRGVDPDRLANRTYIYSGGYLYVRDDTGPPAGLYEATRYIRAFQNNSGSNVVVRGLRMELYSGNAVLMAQGGTGKGVEDCDFELCGDQATNGNGVACLNTTDDGFIRRCRFLNSGTDAIYTVNALRPVIEDCEVNMSFGLAGDGIQLDYTTPAYRQAANAILRRCAFNQVDSPSPKGCVIGFGDNSLYEDLLVAGGLFGVADNGSGGMTRRVVAHKQTDYGIGSVGNGETTVGNQARDCLVFDCVHGLVVDVGTHTQMSYRHLTIADCPGAVRLGTGGITGELVDSILWSPNRTGPVVEVSSTAHGNFPIADCTIGPEISGVPLVRWNGVDYNTLAAWKTATGNGVRCTTADPQFTDPAARDYRLQTSSPARGSATDGDRGCNQTLADARVLRF